ncbi:MAG: sugar phosphate isomerase/epimerase family protein, partial [Candidatus Nanoarchaeia archaeon]
MPYPTESFYPGQATPFDKEYYNSLKPINPDLPTTYFQDIGSSMDARTANQVKQASQHFNTGAKTVEVAGMTPGVFEAMPKDHLKELNRLTKVTGTSATMHGPMIDPTGITQEGWNKINQEAAERQLWSAIERSHDIDPKGNAVVTMHASTAQLPQATLKIKEEGEKEPKTRYQILVDSMGGKLLPLQEKEEPFKEVTEGKKPFNPEEEKEKINEEQWNDIMRRMTYNLDIARERLEAGEEVKEISNLPKSEKFPELEKLKRGARSAQHGAVYLRQTYQQIQDLWDLAYKAARSKEDKEKLKSFAQQVKPLAQELKKPNPDYDKVEKFADVLEDGIETMSEIKPEIFQPLDKFAADKSAETFSNLALKGYKKFKNTAPIISIENHPAGQSLLTTGEDLKNVITSARKQFIEKASKPKKQGGLGLSKSQAKKQAEKLIGATWDVGHINMLRRYGYEKKDILKETDKIAPFVKHVHLSDNFGFEHTELPMGMGNVPHHEIMKRLGKEGFKGKK